MKVQTTLIYDVVRIKFDCYCVKCQAFIGLVLGHKSNKQIYTVVLLVTCTHNVVIFYKILRSIHYNFTRCTCSYLWDERGRGNEVIEQGILWTYNMPMNIIIHSNYNYRFFLSDSCSLLYYYNNSYILKIIKIKRMLFFTQVCICIDVFISLALCIRYHPYLCLLEYIRLHNISNKQKMN